VQALRFIKLIADLPLVYSKVPGQDKFSAMWPLGPAGGTTRRNWRGRRQRRPGEVLRGRRGSPRVGPRPELRWERRRRWSTAALGGCGRWNDYSGKMATRPGQQAARGGLVGACQAVGRLGGSGCGSSAKLDGGAPMACRQSALGTAGGLHARGNGGLLLWATSSAWGRGGSASKQGRARWGTRPW
jgi:hypothetical protein